MNDPKKTDLSKFNNSWYNPGGKIRRVLWFLINASIFQNPVIPFSSLKVRLLRTFGAKIGSGVVIKPKVNIKYPWNLEISDNVWIGEQVWIDCLDMVIIGRNACISQGALILSGNHDYKKTTFDLIIKPIVLEEGTWIGAKSIVTGGVTCGSHAILTVNSVATNDLEPYTIYRGNPAEFVRKREILI